jgi:hypothetical protein
MLTRYVSACKEEIGIATPTEEVLVATVCPKLKPKTKTV